MAYPSWRRAFACTCAHVATSLRHCTTIPQNSTGSPCCTTRFFKEKSKRESGDRKMLDAIQISLALWAMIVCGGIEAVQLLH
jgi:hypothetical protein